MLQEAVSLMGNTTCQLTEVPSKCLIWALSGDSAVLFGPNVASEDGELFCGRRELESENIPVLSSVGNISAPVSVVYSVALSVVDAALSGEHAFSSCDMRVLVKSLMKGDALNCIASMLHSAHDSLGLLDGRRKHALATITTLCRLILTNFDSSMNAASFVSELANIDKV